MDHTHIWHVLEEDPSGNKPPQRDEGKTILVFIVQASSLRRNTTEFVLEAVVRQYCNARIQGPVQKGDPSTTRIESGQLYDVLGLLRSLQYDLAQYNHCVVNCNDMSNNERRYACFRLLQQGMSLGVRLSAPWQQPPDDRKPVVIPGLDELVTYLEKEFQDRLEHAARNLEQGVVDFDSLMELYRPGVDLLDHGLLSGLPTGLTPFLVTCRASHYARGKSAMGNVVSTFHAACEFVVATAGGGGGKGGQFALVETRIFHYEFKGTRRIEAIGNGSSSGGGSVTGEICTKVSNPALLQELEERGQLYQQICSQNSDETTSSASGKLVSYTAGSFWPIKAATQGNNESSSKGAHSGRSSRTGGRMMVDATEAWSRGIHPAKAPADGVAGEAVAEAFKAVARLNRQHEKAAAASASASDSCSTNEESGDDIHESVLVFRAPLPASLMKKTWPVVCGFSFETRRWGLALVDAITPVQFHEQAFDDLVLPPARKRLLRALITSHGHTTTTSGGVDVLPGKGEGIIFLLHGPAGVGKTLTAEAISEVLHRPLYRVSMGELGVTPESLEGRLQDIFDLCLPWQALVLIDEAEMLLEKRTNSGTDLVRNAIVCVMLRLMEYYPGILFLTTNSGKEALDPAIASRLTCTLGYNALNEQGRREVWKTTLNRVTDTATTAATTATPTNTTCLLLSSHITDADLDFLAREYVEINGRQIKNAVQLAAALCRHEKTTLQLAQLQETLEMTNALPRQQRVDVQP